MSADSAQVRAAHPRTSVFVAAHAGSGKTTTLVNRVARLLLDGAAPEAILCVTYTKAGAAEMQRRLFKQLGDWAVMHDAPLREALARIGEPHRDLPDARRLFALALETPGGLKIQTIHAFCEKLLRRFPLEAGISPGFQVLEDQAARQLSARAQASVASYAQAHPDGMVAQAYAHFSVQLAFRQFHEMFVQVEARRGAIESYIEAHGGMEGARADIWRACGLNGPADPDEITDEVVTGTRWNRWDRTIELLLATGMVSDADQAALMKAAADAPSFDTLAAVVLTRQNEPRKSLATKKCDPAAKAALEDEQRRIVEALARKRAATVARDSVFALALAHAYAEVYAEAKRQSRGLDFADLIALTLRLVTKKADAAWVLYKLDGGISHVLLDEAQDTAPQQWRILQALTAEFFAGAGQADLFAPPRTLFAVGDEKQSIFSFQGAAPELLALESQRVAAAAYGARAAFDVAPLTENYRSAPEILSFVDVVFRDPAAHAGLSPGADVIALPLRHEARRPAGGCVDIWPIDITEPWEQPDPWEPVDAEPPKSANKTLGGRIARTIKAMIDRGDVVRERRTDEPRPCTAGDFLILVRRRGPLFDETIRALKRAGVAVGGADRMLLSDHIAFDDLMGLGRLARFPEDDLTVAALLRSPLCDVGETDLFDLAWRREGSLWKVLGERAGERVCWGAALATLTWAMEESKGRSAFDFYNRVLARPGGDGRTLRARMLARLGAEANDAIDAFLAEALAAERRNVRDLESFLASMALSEIEVKREAADGEGLGGGGEVRVMTVHGAKGLEAPIVFLPDTTSKAAAFLEPLLATADGGLLWAPRKGDDCPASAAAREARELANDHESLRLLYVALTRARDRLIICGVESRRFKDSWRDYIDRAREHLDMRPFALEDGGEGWRYGTDPIPALGRAVRLTFAPAPPAFGDLTDERTLRPASPSHLTGMDESAVPSPLASVQGLGRFRRGDLIHKLLQWLPDVAPQERPAAAARLLSREADLMDDQRAEMAAAALAVLEDAQFADVFGPGSRPEAALAGGAGRLPPDLRISGRVDRLLVQSDRVLVVDYKTNRPAPARIEDADPAYVLQMAVYWAVLGEVFPGRRIEAALVWTDGPRLMPVPEKLMAATLDELASSR